jgi:hypothetical protein
MASDEFISKIFVLLIASGIKVHAARIRQSDSPIRDDTYIFAEIPLFAKIAYLETYWNIFPGRYLLICVSIYIEIYHSGLLLIGVSKLNISIHEKEMPTVQKDMNAINNKSELRLLELMARKSDGKPF